MRQGTIFDRLKHITAKCCSALEVNFNSGNYDHDIFFSGKYTQDPFTSADGGD